MDGNLTEECIGKGDGINSLHCRILREIRIDEEENRHVHGFPGIQLLFFEAKALDLAEVRSDLSGRDTVRRDSDDIRRTFVRRSIESQCRFARKDSDLSLLWRELPWENIRNRAIERNSEAAGVRYRRYARRGVAISYTVSKDGLTIPASLLADL